MIFFVEHKRGKLSELVCAVLCTTVLHSDTRTHEQSLQLTVRFTFRFSLWVCFDLAFCMFSVLA